MTRRSIFKGRISPLKIFLTILSLSVLLLAVSCKKELSLSDSVSEYRSNLLLYECADFSVKAQDVEKEYPYVADGYKNQMTHRTELFISAPAETERCDVLFLLGGIEHKGDASYDNVKKQFYYSCAANLSNAESLPIRLSFDGEEHEITLRSVKTEKLLGLDGLLSALFKQESELLKTLVRGREFAGELYVRLLYEDDLYYYVGVVDRNGQMTAFLLDGETGAVLAKRAP